jgi:hypothetical protein
MFSVNHNLLKESRKNMNYSSQDKEEKLLLYLNRQKNKPVIIK